MTVTERVSGVEGQYYPETWDGTAMMIELFDSIKRQTGVVPDSVFSQQSLLVGFDSLSDETPRGFKYALFRIHGADDSYFVRSGWGTKGQERSLCPFTAESAHLWFIDEDTFVRMTDEQVIDWSRQAALCLKKNGLAVVVSNTLPKNMTAAKWLLRPFGVRLRTSEQVIRLVTPTLKLVIFGFDAKREYLPHLILARADSDFPCIEEPIECFGD